MYHLPEGTVFLFTIKLIHWWNKGVDHENIIPDTLFVSIIDAKVSNLNAFLIYSCLHATCSGVKTEILCCPTFDCTFPYFRTTSSTVNYRNRLPPALGGRIWFLTKCLLRDYVGFDLSGDTVVLMLLKDFFLKIPPMISDTVDVYLLFVLFALCWC